MKTTTTIFALILSIGIARSQVPSTCDIPFNLLNEYERDIAQLATYRLFLTHSPDTSLVTIPQEHIDTIAQGLAAIINVSSIPERDSVFNLYCVRNFNGWPGPYGGFLVKVDTSYEWTQSWQELNTLTGNTFIDSILNNYNLTVSDFYYWSIGNYALLTVGSSWNMIALMDSISLVDGVISVEPNYIMGGAGLITYDYIGNSRYYNFTYEWQDCFDGCDAKKTWKFKVNSDCSVEYLGYDYSCALEQFGVICDPIPPPSNCNLFTAVEESPFQNFEYTIFPNPSNNKINIEMSKVINEIQVLNTLGQTLLKLDYTKEIDISGFKPGVYILIISGDNFKLKERIIVY